MFKRYIKETTVKIESCSPINKYIIKAYNKLTNIQFIRKLNSVLIINTDYKKLAIDFFFHLLSKQLSILCVKHNVLGK